LGVGWKEQLKADMLEYYTLINGGQTDVNSALTFWCVINNDVLLESKLIFLLGARYGATLRSLNNTIH